VTQRSARHLLIRHEGTVLHVQFNRPEVHNALNADLVAELTACLTSISADGSVRALLLSGAGPSFCAGADLAWMRTVAGFSHEENLADAQKLATLLAALNGCPVPTVARVHGVTLGGGVGLLACCDAVLAADDVRFGFTEAKLGLLPAVIAPYVVAKIGESHTRALFASAERFDAQRALLIGLVHRVVPAGDLDAAVERQLRELLTSAPGAAAAARTLIQQVKSKPPTEVEDYTTETLARLRTGAEGREGLDAFLEKRPPSWTVTMSDRG
jgi:methylglutaconyl-CoA hydratase